VDIFAEPNKMHEIATMVQVNATEAINRLKAKYGPISTDRRKLAVARAINHTMAKIKTMSSREIRKIYALDAKTVNDALRQVKADRLTLTGKVIGKGKPIPLYKFKARQTKQGVTVTVINGKRKFIPGVFLAKMKNGHMGVMFRGKYAGRNMQRRKNRIAKTGPDLPITQMSGVSIPKSLTNDVVTKSLMRGINEMFPKRLEHEIKRVDSIV
jgi:predicted transcriptional regulator